jgi:uncharacterized protein
MRFNPFPKEDKYFDSFRNQARIIHEAACLMQEVASDWTTHEAKIRRIGELEHECDSIVHDVATALHKTFVTPIDREDIHGLLTRLDDVMDHIHGAAVRMELFAIEETNETFVRLANVLERSAVAVEKGVQALPTFKNLDEPRQEMERLEEESDEIYHKALADLFEQRADALYVIKWKELYEKLERAVDICEDVFDIMEAIVLKHG